MDNLTRSWKNQIAIATGSRASGTSDINGASTDLFGFSCAVLMVEFGSISASAVTSVKVQDSDDGTTWADLANSEQSVEADDDHNVVMIELTHPLKRYARAHIDRGTAAATITTARWLLGHAAAEPVTQSSDVITKLVH